MKKKYLMLYAVILCMANNAWTQNINCCTTDECIKFYLSGAAEAHWDEFDKITMHNGQNQVWIVSQDMIKRMEKIQSSEFRQSRMPMSTDYLGQNINEEYANSCDEIALDKGPDNYELVGKGSLDIVGKKYQNVSKTKMVSIIASNDYGIKYTTNYNWYLANSLSPSFAIQETHTESVAGGKITTRRYYMNPALETKGGIMSISPNPIKQIATITLQLEEIPAGVLKLTIVDNSGITKLEKTLNGSEKSINVDFSKWLTGLYRVYLLKDAQTLDVSQVIKE